MDYKEARDWLCGDRSTTNMVPQHPLETWVIRIAEADAAMMQQAYWIVRAHAEGLLWSGKRQDVQIPPEIERVE